MPLHSLEDLFFHVSSAPGTYVANTGLPFSLSEGPNELIVKSRLHEEWEMKKEENKVKANAKETIPNAYPSPSDEA